MNLKDDIKPISYIKTNAADMLKRVNETHNPIIITQNGEAKAVLIDTESYQEMRNSLGILKILTESEKYLAEGDVIPQEDVFRSIESKLEKKQKNL